MIYPQNRPRSNRGCWWPSVLALLGIPFVIVAFAVLAWIGRESSGRKQLNARVAELRAQNLPVDDASLQRFYEQQTDAEDTQAWLAVINTMTSQEFRDSTSQVPHFDGQALERVPLPDEAWESESETRAFLQRWRMLHRQISQLAANGKPVRFPIEWDSLNTLLIQTQEMRNAARLLRLDGEVALRDADSQAVRRDIAGLFGTSQVNAGEPVLVSQLVSIAIDGMALQLLKDALEYDVLAPADLRALLPFVMAETQISPGWQNAMIGERAMMLPLFADASRMGSSVPQIPGRSRDALYYLETIDQALEAPTQDISQYLAKLEEVEAQMTRLAQGNWLVKFDSILTQQLLPALSGAGNAFARKAVLHRLAAVAIGIRLYQREYGRFPSQLDDLAELSLELEALAPPGESSFGYRLDNAGATLWSYNLRTSSSLPSEPPNTEEGQPDAEENALWVWELRGK